MKPVTKKSSIALNTQQKHKKISKGDCSSKESDALCHLPSHVLSMHTNAECRTQHPSLQPNRVQSNTRPMGRTSSAPGPISRGLAAVSFLTDAEKARLFDHLQHAHANLASSNQPPITADSTSEPADDTQQGSHHVCME